MQMSDTPTPLRLIVFDFDGTLADTSRHIVLTVQRTQRTPSPRCIPL